MGLWDFLGPVLQMTEFQRSGAPNQETLAWQGLDQIVLRMDESLGFSRPFQAGCTYMLAPKDEVKTMGKDYLLHSLLQQLELLE